MAAPPALAPQETEVTFAGDLGLFDATMIGIGGMIMQRYEGPVKSLVKRIMG